MRIARHQLLDAAGGFMGTEEDDKEAQRCQVSDCETK